MKNFATIFMLFTYLLFNAGVSYSMHFCGSKLTSTEVFKAKKGCICSSSKKEKEAKPHCCKDVEVESAGDEQQTSTLFKVNLEKVLLAEFNFLFLEFEKLFKTSSNQNLVTHSPPLYKVPLFIFNKIFRL